MVAVRKFGLWIKLELQRPSLGKCNYNYMTAEDDYCTIFGKSIEYEEQVMTCVCI